MREMKASGVKKTQGTCAHSVMRYPQVSHEFDWRAASKQSRREVSDWRGAGGVGFEQDPK